MDQIPFRHIVLELDKYVFSIWKECTPKLLVVTDGLSYTSTVAFGLTQFVDTLKSATIHGMTPQVITASRYNTANADLPNFKFDDAAKGLLKARYDVVFLLGIHEENVGQLPQAEIDAIARFMQAGGGVFATGDHEDLGAAMSRDLPRVRGMRFWKQDETPDANDDTRLTTNLPGANAQYEFDDQADLVPQRLFVNYRTESGGVGNPHPLLQDSGTGVIEVFPDHPHEGECRVPDDLTTLFALDGNKVKEWPLATGGSQPVVPEMVALTMSHGDSFPGKQAVVPRSFIAIAAYDGQKANVGRVVTDATWHHYVNVNLDGSGSPGNGMQDPLGTDTPDLVRIRRYYRNLAAWLMPKTVRKCLRFPLFFEYIKRYPLFEELKVPRIETATAAELHTVGEQVAAALTHDLSRAHADELIRDALEDALGPEKAAALWKHEDRFGRMSARDAGLAALGTIVSAFVAKLADVKNLREVDPHKTFGPMAEQAAKDGLRRFAEESVREAGEVTGLLRDAVR